MTARTIAAGSDFMAFEETGIEGAEVYRPISGQSNCVLTEEVNNRETIAKNIGGAKDHFKGLEGWAVAIEMDIPDNVGDPDATEVSFEELQDIQKAGTKPTWVFAWVTFSALHVASIDTTKRMYRGVASVNCPLNAASGENATTSVALQGALFIDYTDPV